MRKTVDPTLAEIKGASWKGVFRVEYWPEEEGMKEYIQAFINFGGLYTHSQAARMMGVSTQRVSQLTGKGQLPLLEIVHVAAGVGGVFEESLIPGNAIRRWQAMPKTKGGRGTRKAVTLEECAA